MITYTQVVLEFVTNKANSKFFKYGPRHLRIRVNGYPLEKGFHVYDRTVLVNEISLKAMREDAQVLASKLKIPFIDNTK